MNKSKKAQEDLSYLLDLNDDDYDDTVEFIDDEEELFWFDGFNESEEADSIPAIKNEEEFFDIYEKVKNKEKSIEELSIIDLWRISVLLKKEVEVKQQELEEE